MPLLLTLTSDVDLDDDQVMTQVVGPAGLTIGRGLDNDWIIKDPRRLMSKHHCRVDVSGATFIITDSSTNGVFLNGSAVPLGRGNTAVVGDGDRLRLGDLEVVVQAIPEADAAALSGMMVDPFASSSSSFAQTPGLGGDALPVESDDPWGGWVPPGGLSGDDSEASPFGASPGSGGRSGPGLGRGLMPSGDGLFGRESESPEEGSAGPWGDDAWLRERGGDGDDEGWAVDGTDQDRGAPEALAFTPQTLSLPEEADGAATDFPVEDEGSVGPTPSHPADDSIPEDWDDEWESDGESGDESEADFGRALGGHSEDNSPPVMIPDDMPVEEGIGSVDESIGDPLDGPGADEKTAGTESVFVSSPIPEDFDLLADLALPADEGAGETPGPGSFAVSGHDALSVSAPTPPPTATPTPAPALAPTLASGPALDAVMAVFEECLARLEPSVLMADLPSLGDPAAMPPAVRQARAWVVYEHRYAEVKQDGRQRMAQLLGITLPDEPGSQSRSGAKSQ